MAEPFGHNAIMTAGNHLKMSFTSLGMSDGNFKNWILFFFLMLELVHIQEAQAPPATGGGTSNQELGDLVRQ